MSDTSSAVPETRQDQAGDTPALPGFDELGLTGPVLAAIKDLGYETPSAIQAATIPVLLGGRDVVGMAQTGTGKTAAFALPIMENLDLTQKTPQALVLAPTRELALQVCEAFESYAARMKNVHILPVYGGQGYGVQLSALRRGVHIVVGTPGRIMDHLEKGTLDLSELKNLVLDEADEMLKMGFAEDVEQILAQTPEEKQVALFSATMPASIRRLAQQYLRDPEEITVKTKTSTNTNITQRYLIVSYQQKVDALTRILEVEDFDGMIIFVRTKNETETLAEKLRARGFSAAPINGDIPQPQRERSIQQLKDGKLDILVATDVAARGLDVERISHVVNFDIPTDTESYVHRIGRTGRAGRKGDAISFVTPRERYLLAHIERATRQAPTQMQLPTTEDINSTRLTRFDDAITAALAETDRIAGFRDVIAHYVRNHDVPEQDVAAALAVVAQGETPLLLDPAADQLAKTLAADAQRGVRKERTDRPDGGGRERRSKGDFTTYRIDVGRRQRVEPRQIVGALANEGGLGRDDFGAITIRPDFSLVELPTSMDSSVLDRLRDTRISGQRINIAPDRGRPGHRRDDTRRDDTRRDDTRRDRPQRSFDDRPARKPRHKND
ncbi:ATP-dependent RNA helicase DeaD [Microbacterium marinum]|uniref:ATP-dependent RNA helicase DeaD n=1 Tax=Microbacterium marinum TaxID=421115 RepID=A0A7W7BUR5_9MICO|nr:ATP-dependent RNA helicase DeaD [Microbacterium marinum]